MLPAFIRWFSISDGRRLEVVAEEVDDDEVLDDDAEAVFAVVCLGGLPCH